MVPARQAFWTVVTVLAMGASAGCGDGSSDARLANPTTSASTTSASTTTTPTSTTSTSALATSASTTTTSAGGPGDVVGAGCRADQVDINTATSAELQRIVHIDRSRARWITEGRPWPSIDALDILAGIDEPHVADIVEQDIACIGG